MASAPGVTLRAWIFAAEAPSLTNISNTAAGVSPTFRNPCGVPFSMKTARHGFRRADGDLEVSRDRRPQVRPDILVGMDTANSAGLNLDLHHGGLQVDPLTGLG